MGQNIKPIFWPYDEVEFGYDPGTAVLTTSCPWFRSDSTISEEGREFVEVAVEAHKMGRQDPASFTLIPKLMVLLEPYPLYYTLPRGDLPTQTDLQERTPKDITPKWDLDTALQFARTKHGFDPLSLLTVARRFHLIEAQEKIQTENIFASLETNPRAREVLALIVRQNYEVTRRCEATLAPARDTFPPARAAVEAFMKEEHGHENILMKAVKDFTNDPDSIPVLPETTAIMDFFEWTARNHYLAFAMVVDMFERSSYREDHPFASLLSKLGHAEAARLIQAHGDINSEGDHHNVSFELIETMGSVDETYAKEAILYAQHATGLLGAMSKKLTETLKEI